jgi:hypothetical protein
MWRPSRALTGEGGDDLDVGVGFGHLGFFEPAFAVAEDAVDIGEALIPPAGLEDFRLIAAGEFEFELLQVALLEHVHRGHLGVQALGLKESGFAGHAGIRHLPGSRPRRAKKGAGSSSSATSPLRVPKPSWCWISR